MKEPRSKASAELGHRVRTLRDRKTLSRRQLADLSGLDISHVARVENGQGNPTLFALIQLATALDTTSERLVAGLAASDLPPDVYPYSAALFRREQESARRTA